MARIREARRKAAKNMKIWNELQESYLPLYKDEEKESGEKEERIAVFGDIAVVENLENRISDEEFKHIQSDFDLFQKLIANSTDTKEQAFLASRHVFRVLMGLTPEASFFPNEAKVLYGALKKAGAIDRFTIFTSGKDGSFLSFLHLNRAESLLKKHKDELNLKITEEKLTDNQVIDTVASLYNDSDAHKRHLAIGLFSGIPKGSVEWWLKKEDVAHLNKYSLTPIDKKTEAFLESADAIPLDQERISGEYTRSYLQFGEAKPQQSGAEITIRGFGTDFKTTYPPSQEVIDHCQRLFEIERRLGVIDFISETRKLIDARRTLQDITS